MNIVITCGPSFEPIDQVRRLTNFSTGRLGVTLANHFARAGHNVTCLKGMLAIAPDPLAAVRLLRFETNASLAERLEAEATPNSDLVVLHAAALCDFQVARLDNPTSITPQPGKIPTRDGSFQLTLEPAVKILPKLREWFPQARIAGWKYEVDGSRTDVLAKAKEQLHSARSNACIVNGPAWGSGFGLYRLDQAVQQALSPQDLCRLLDSWISSTA